MKYFRTNSLENYYRTHKRINLLGFASYNLPNLTTEHLQATDTLDFDNISFLDKIVFCMPYEEIDIDIPKYICLPCCSALRISYRFQLMLLKNHKQMKGYVTQMQKNNVRKQQSVLKIKLVDFKKQASRNKRKLQVYNKQEQKTKETVNSNNPSKSDVKAKYVKSDSVIYQSTEKDINSEPDTFQIVIKEEKSIDDSSKTLLGFTNNDTSCTLCDSKSNITEIDESSKNKVDNKFICSICSKVYNKINEFNYHMLFHDSSKLFKCKLCDKSFATVVDVRRHCTVLHVKGGK